MLLCGDDERFAGNSAFEYNKCTVFTLFWSVGWLVCCDPPSAEIPPSTLGVSCFRVIRYARPFDFRSLFPLFPLTHPPLIRREWQLSVLFLLPPLTVLVSGPSLFPLGALFSPCTCFLESVAVLRVVSAQSDTWDLSLPSPRFFFSLSPFHVVSPTATCLFLFLFIFFLRVLGVTCSFDLVFLFCGGSFFSLPSPGFFSAWLPFCIARPAFFELTKPHHPSSCPDL